MLIRFYIDNILSFGKGREFDMLPSPRYTRLAHHKYKINDFNVLKLSSIYGANGSGKSNLIQGLSRLREIVVNGEIPSNLNSEKFKLSKDNEGKSQILATEFLKNNKAFYYGIEIENDIVKTEELYESGLGKREDVLLFERKTDEYGKVKTKFFSEFENDNESKTLKSVIEKTLSKPGKPLFKLISELDNDFLKKIKIPFDWFAKDLIILMPSSKPVALAENIDINNTFKEFVNDTMCTFDTGIKKIQTETKTLKEFFGEDKANIDKLTKILNENPSQRVILQSNKGEEVVAVNENDKLLIKRLVLMHLNDNNKFVEFYLNEESDGTNRLLDYLPAFQDIINENKVYIIDEVERSIHPLLIKELIDKYSKDENTKGQLIFTTHESNLLDQDILRQDEIWFMEKDPNGCSDMYPLSEFKEHHTKSIKKGYLNGRYGAIPFLSNLKDLNWNKYGTTR
ncbi:MAG: ATP-binding protein [Bacteroidales bacterium]